MSFYARFKWPNGDLGWLMSSLGRDPWRYTEYSDNAYDFNSKEEVLKVLEGLPPALKAGGIWEAVEWKDEGLPTRGTYSDGTPSANGFSQDAVDAIEEAKRIRLGKDLIRQGLALLEENSGTGVIQFRTRPVTKSKPLKDSKVLELEQALRACIEAWDSDEGMTEACEHARKLLSET